MNILLVAFLLIHTNNGSYEVTKVTARYNNSFVCQKDKDVLEKSDLTLSVECYKELPPI